MKKISALLLALILALAMAGCAQEGDPSTGAQGNGQQPFENGTYQSDVPGIRIQLSGIYHTDGQSKLVMTWLNDTEFSISYGEAFEIQRLENGEWVNCALQDTSFGDATVTLGPGGFRNKSYILTDLYDLTVPGPYRFLTSCMVLKENGTQEECSLLVSFHVN